MIKLLTKKKIIAAMCNARNVLIPFISNRYAQPNQWNSLRNQATVRKRKTRLEHRLYGRIRGNRPRYQTKY